MLRVVVLVSGSGTLLQSLIDATQDPSYGVEIVAVGSDRRKAYGLVRAQEAGIETFALPYRKGEDRAAWDRELTARIAAHEPDVIVSAGFMKLVGEAFLDRFAGRMLNTHPALLPSFPGMYGVRDALAYGVKVSGASLFVVDAGVDSGRIIDQRTVRVHDDDTEETLHERIKVEEREMLVDHLRRRAAGEFVA
ncbi:MAG TPA: phosphoribosylglycinamide formyltransferase [Candidatus Avipropionibacterium avicola]|uniref:Phosphoribosylglycinamide formyltransferase n=1 Tax=Candidatus Avipropionibacterium avicola TaxID=2840701 RepID=A0A9D1GYU3_9ACTN|nr:phosphoribosylglycinamide formyltransferase [Candidatus Avipropionibacterium avicola]